MVGGADVPDGSFEQFTRDALPALSRYAYALAGRDDGADLVQDTLVKVAGAWRRVHTDGNPIGYARTVMFRTYVSRWRLNRRRPTVALGDDDPPAERDAYATVENRDALRWALQGISREQRAVLVLTYLEQADDADIAELLGRRPATVRSLRARGLAAVRAQLGADGTDIARVGIGTEATVGGEYGPA
jgi:RNA polymerase sigma factor (sigma-70 family)